MTISSYFRIPHLNIPDLRGLDQVTTTMNYASAGLLIVSSTIYGACMARKYTNSRLKGALLGAITSAVVTAFAALTMRNPLAGLATLVAFHQVIKKNMDVPFNPIVQNVAFYSLTAFAGFTYLKERGYIL